MMICKFMVECTCDEMNIHQHKSEQVAFGSRHLRQVCDFTMSAFVTVTCVFAGTYSVCILVCFNCYKYGLLQSDIVRGNCP